MVTLRSGGKIRLRGGGGVVEPVGGAVLAGVSFVALERLDVGGVFDLPAAVERAPMGREHGGGVEHAHGLEGGRDDEGIGGNEGADAPSRAAIAAGRTR